MLTTYHVKQIELSFENGVLPLAIHQEVLLGRRSLHGQPSIDLSDFGAYALGVSRTHAALTVEGDQLYIEDHGSDEGTWLNDQLLVPFRRYPLEDGDVICLGRLQATLHL